MGSSRRGTSKKGRPTWWRSASLALLAAVAMGACGDNDPEADASPPVTLDRGAVIERYGRAWLLGDTEAMVDLFEPGVRQSLSAEDLAWMEGMAPPSDRVEVKRFNHRIVREGERSVDVVYSGERCAPTLTQEFGPSSTVVSGGDDDTAEPSTVDEGVTVEGEIVCHDIEEGMALFGPAEFVQVDGQWYAKMPDL